ncbi:MAG: YidC/Oxa1 family membrane protein insertase [Caldilineaceae bacterium]
MDVVNTAPQVFGRRSLFWPLAKALIWLDGVLQRIGMLLSLGLCHHCLHADHQVDHLPAHIDTDPRMQAQKELQPKIQELQKIRQRSVQETFAPRWNSISEAGVNPLSGCLPLVIQMPISFGSSALRQSARVSPTPASFDPQSGLSSTRRV